jgi:hypothetical protein
MRKLEAESVRKILQRRRIRMRGGTGKGRVVGTGELWLRSVSGRTDLCESDIVFGERGGQRESRRFFSPTISEGSFPE